MWHPGDNLKSFRENGWGNPGGGAGGRAGATGNPPNMPTPASGLPNMPKIPDAVDIPRGVPGGAVPWFPPIPKPPGSAGGAGKPAGKDWGAANSAPGKSPSTPDGRGDYGYSQSGRVSRTSWTRWTLTISSSGVVKHYARINLRPPGKMWVGKVSTFRDSYGRIIVNPIPYYRTNDAGHPGQTVMNLSGPYGYGFPVSTLSINLTAQPLNPLDETDPMDAVGGTAPEGWEPATDFPRIPAPPALPKAPPKTKPATSPPQPQPNPGTKPQPQPQPQPQPLPQPQPMPLPAPAPSRAPAAAPRLPKVGPANVGTGRKVSGSGGVASPAAPKPETTPAGRKVVGSAAKPVTVDPAQVPETMAGIAAEVGRIESKVGSLLQRPELDLGAAMDRFDLLEDLLQQFWDYLQGIDGAGSYSLDSTCEVDEEGAKRPPVAVSFPESSGSTAAITKRLDALAGLLQVHKDLRQPSCKHPRPQGDAVTVNFSEV